MNKKTIVSLVAAAALSSGVVFAQTPPPAAKPTKPAPAPTDKAAPAPAAKAGEKPAAPEGMAAPAPSEALLAAAKKMQGTWKCTGTVNLPDGTSRESVATTSSKLDLDKMWIVTTMKEKKSKANPSPYSFVSYRTHDVKTGKWTNVMVDNMGGWGQSTSTAAGEGAMTWDGKSHMGGMTMMVKDTEEMKSPKEVHMAGQASMDGGKKWMPYYDITCKK